MEDSQALGHRQRSRIACETCRARKRKCDGGQPCDRCTKDSFNCISRSQPRKRRRKAQDAMADAHIPLIKSPSDPSITVGKSAEQRPQRDASSFVQSLESNSGSAFVRTFAMAVDPKNTVSLQTPAWNVFLGERQLTLSAVPRAITDVLSLVDMQALVDVYFDKVDPCYGFLEKDTIYRAVQQRWRSNASSSVYDAVPCLIGAIGCVFSSLKDLQVEACLFSLAKSRLGLAIAQDATVEVAFAWVLRTVYLRLTAKPEEAWMASCTALHLIDAVGLHCEPGLNTLASRAGQQIDPDLRRRIFGVARHLNVWLSFDLARSRVVLQNSSSVLPSPRSGGDYTLELLEMLPLTEKLDPGQALSNEELLSTFSQVLNRTHSQPPSIQAQCNLMLCLYRRLYTLGCKIPDERLERAVTLIKEGLQAVYLMIESRSPWHHMANIPFQSICTLLAIDTTHSFSILAEAMSCLEAVSEAFPTKATTDAVAAARALVYMHQKRREADFRRQSEMLKFYPTTQPAYEETFQDFPLSQAFEDLPWFNDLLPNENFDIMGSSWTMF